MFQGTKAVKTIFYANIITYIVFQILGLINLGGLMSLFCAWPFEHKLFIPFQLITYQFLHAGILHIAFNMIAFISLAPLVENYLSTTRKFYIYYLICGIMSALLHMIMVDGNSPLVGASGSIWGVTAMFALISPNQKLNIIFIPIDIKSKYLIGALFLIEVSLCILGSKDSVSHWGHVGGAITGFLFFMYEKYICKNPN